MCGIIGYTGKDSFRVMMADAVYDTLSINFQPHPEINRLPLTALPVTVG